MKRLRGLIPALLPLFWLLVFFAAPFVIVFKISLSQTAIAMPPYTPVLDLGEGFAGVRDFFAGLSLESYQTLAADNLYVASLFRSLALAAISTVLLLAIGYPLAYGMSRLPRTWQVFAVLAVFLPFLTAFLIRIYAWISILQREGLLNKALLALGLISEPLTWLATDTAVLIGMVYSYLPFMVLPLFASLERMDESLIEAARDLGAPRWKAFWLVTVPLSRPGIVAGMLLCFIPLLGEYVIPDLLGASNAPLIGQTLWSEFFLNKDWPVASALAVILLLVLLFPILLQQRSQRREWDGAR